MQHGNRVWKFGLMPDPSSLVQARSERGSRRLPRERSSEISKNCHKNYLYKHPNIHVRGNKSGRQIWAFFVVFSCALQNDLQIYMGVEINRAGKFGPFLLRFRTLSNMTAKYTSAWKYIGPANLGLFCCVFVRSQI